MDFTVFVVVTQQYHKNVGSFYEWNNWCDSLILQIFSSVPNDRHLDLLKQMNAEKHLKLWQQKGMGMIASYISISLIRLDQNQNE